jgi:pyrroloquinoline quinone biosynthesis protein D
MQQSYVLLYPEGMVKLSLSAAEVLKRCDGKHTVAELLNSLKAQFPRGEGLEQDVRAFLEVAYELGWIRNRPQN